MGNTTLMAVLRMPPDLWGHDLFDQTQRHIRYVYAADRIEELESAIKGIAPWLSASLSDTSHKPCQGYINACEGIFKAESK